MKRLLPFSILAVGVGGFAALQAHRPEPEPIEAQERAWIVAVAPVMAGTHSPELALYGRVDSPRVARLSAAITADVRDVTALEGQRVGADQTVVELDSREAMLVLRQREAEVADIRAQVDSERERHVNDRRAMVHEKTLLDLSRAEVRRAENLASTQVGSRSALDEKRQQAEQRALTLENRKLAIREHDIRNARLAAQLERALAIRDGAALDVSRTRIAAPFEGRISEVSVAPGDRVRAGDALLTIYDTNAIEVRAQIPTRHLPLVRRALESGQRLSARAVVDALPVEARLERLSGQVAKRSGGADGFFRVTSGGRWLQLGRTIELVVELPAAPDVVVVPYEAIYGTDRIYVLDGERMRGITVQRVGDIRAADGESRALVRSEHLGAGDRIVVTQLPNAVDGLRVRLAEP